MFSSSYDRTAVFIFYCYLIGEVAITTSDILLPSEFVEIDSANNAGFEFANHGNGAFVPVEGSNHGFVSITNPNREGVEIVEMANDGSIPINYDVIDSSISMDHNNHALEMAAIGNGGPVPISQDGLEITEVGNSGSIPIIRYDQALETAEIEGGGSIPVEENHGLEISEIGNGVSVPISQDSLEIPNIGNSGSFQIAEVDSGGSIPAEENHGLEITEIGSDGPSIPISQDDQGSVITEIDSSDSIPLDQGNHDSEIPEIVSGDSIPTDPSNQHGLEITEIGSDGPSIPISQDDQGSVITEIDSSDSIFLDQGNHGLDIPEIVSGDSIPTDQSNHGLEIPEIGSDGSINQNHGVEIGDISSAGSVSIDHDNAGLEITETDADGEGSMTPGGGDLALVEDTPDIHLNLRNLQTVRDLLAMRKDNSFVIEASESEIMHLIALGMIRETQVVPLTTLLQVYDATKEDRTFHPEKPYVPTTWPEELDNDDAEDSASAKPEDVNSDQSDIVDVHFEEASEIPTENVVYQNNGFENFIGRSDFHSQNSSDSDAGRSSKLNKLPRGPNPHSNLNGISISSTPGPIKYLFPETTSAKNPEFPILSKIVSESEDNLQNFVSGEEKSSTVPTKRDYISSPPPPPNAGIEVPSEQVAQISVETKFDEERRGDIESNDIDIDDSTLNPVEIKPNLNETISNSLKPSTISQSSKDPTLNDLPKSNKTIPNSLKPSTKSKTKAANVILNFVQQNFFFVAENETGENSHSFTHKDGVKRHSQKRVSTRLHGESEKSFSYLGGESDKPIFEPSSMEGIQRKNDEHNLRTCNPISESKMYEKAWQHFLLHLFRDTKKKLTPAAPEFTSTHFKADDSVSTCNQVKCRQVNTPNDFVKMTSSHPYKSEHKQSNVLENNFKSSSRCGKPGCNKVDRARHKLSSKTLHPLLTSKKFDVNSKLNKRHNDKFMSNLYENLFRRYKNKRPKKHHHHEDYVHEDTLHYKIPFLKGH